MIYLEVDVNLDGISQCRIIADGVLVGNRTAPNLSDLISMVVHTAKAIGADYVTLDHRGAGLSVAQEVGRCGVVVKDLESKRPDKAAPERVKMTDAQHASAIQAAADALNKALLVAEANGLTVSDFKRSFHSGPSGDPKTGTKITFVIERKFDVMV